MATEKQSFGSDKVGPAVAAFAQTTDVVGGAVDATELGKTYVADEVVATIASIAAEQVAGVHRLGDTGFKGIFGRMGRNTGVGSEVGMKQAAISLDVVIEYGYRLNEVAAELRERVIEAVQYMADREVIAVDINIVDVHVPGEVQPRSSRVLE